MLMMPLFAAAMLAGQPATAPASTPAPAAQPPATPASSPAPAAAKPTEPVGPLGFTVKSIDGKDVKLSDYRGQVVMIVNVASRCGYTKQYKGLESLYREKKAKGFVILGFPANNFGGQEPDGDDEIARFCRDTYSVTFPMFSKISVKGSDQHPLYKLLTGQPAPIGGDPGWNFTKFVIDREGKVAARFNTQVAPDAKELVEKVDELLAKPGPGKPPETKPAETKPADAKPGESKPAGKKPDAIPPGAGSGGGEPKKGG
jgi:glutathione peroxidase